jgi:cytosine/adenosine deaminase-related metal-dependent hydrolase
MRIKIEATWIVGYEREQHTLVRDGELVFEGNRILHVGQGFEGRVDRVIDAKGKLVSPGFIDTHVHSGHRASHRLITGSRFSKFPFPRKARSSKAIRVTSSTAMPDRRRPSSSMPRSPWPSFCATA